MTRDLGLALARLADDDKEPGPRVAPLAVPLLESAVANDPEDWLAWEAKARLLEAVGRRSEALAAYQTVTVGGAEAGGCTRRWGGARPGAGAGRSGS